MAAVPDQPKQPLHRSAGLALQVRQGIRQAEPPWIFFRPRQFMRLPRWSSARDLREVRSWRDTGLWLWSNRAVSLLEVGRKVSRIDPIPVHRTDRHPHPKFVDTSEAGAMARAASVKGRLAAPREDTEVCTSTHIETWAAALRQAG